MKGLGHLTGFTDAPSTVLQVQDGYWQGPPFGANSRQYYRLIFQSYAEVPGFWAVKFFDKEGNMLKDEHDSAIEQSEGWINNEFYFQSKEGADSARLWFYPLTATPGKTVSVRDIRIMAASSERIQEKTFRAKQH